MEVTDFKFFFTNDMTIYVIPLEIEKKKPMFSRMFK